MSYHAVCCTGLTSDSDNFPPHHLHLPFGGSDLIFTSDPGQLGSVSPSSLSIPYKMLGSNSERNGRRLWESIECFFCLQQQNRGLSDPEWFAMLRRVRKGNPSLKDVDLINSRVLALPNNLPLTVSYLTYRNCDVDEANEAALNRLGQRIFSLPCRHDARSRSSYTYMQAQDANAIRLLL